MNKILGIILVLLMILVGGKRGAKTSITLVLNFMLLIIMFYLITIGVNPIYVSLVGCLIISYIILFFINGNNIKTRSSFMSVCTVLLCMSFIIIVTTKISMIAGFGLESFEEIDMFSYDIGLNLTRVTTSLILIGLIGAVVDASIAISSAVYEVYINNKNLTRSELLKSGINIGKDILGTTINTLFFVFLGEFITLLLLFYGSKYSFGEIINAKVFSAEVIKILFIAIGSIVVIPISAYIISYNIERSNKIKNKEGENDEKRKVNSN